MSTWVENLNNSSSGALLSVSSKGVIAIGKVRAHMELKIFVLTIGTFYGISSNSLSSSWFGE